MPFVQGIHRSPVNSPQKGQWRGVDVFFNLRPNKRLSKQSWGWWFETPSRHCNAHITNIWLRKHRGVSYSVRVDGEFCMNVHVMADRIYPINTNKVTFFVILLCLYRHFIRHLWDICPYLQQCLTSTDTECPWICPMGYKYISWYINNTQIVCKTFRDAPLVCMFTIGQDSGLCSIRCQSPNWINGDLLPVSSSELNFTDIE